VDLGREGPFGEQDLRLSFEALHREIVIDIHSIIITRFMLTVWDGLLSSYVFEYALILLLLPL
jgi:hypothetical protein